MKVRTFILLSWFAFPLLAQHADCADKPVIAQPRVYHFPAAQVGRVQMYFTDKFGNSYTRGNFLAKGDVRLPEGELGIVVNYEGRQRLDFLNAYKDDLVMLSLADLDVTDDVTDCLAGFHRLKSLDLANTEISDATLLKLRNLTDLRELKVSRTNVKGPGLAVTKYMPKLRELSLSHNLLDANALSYLPDLKELDGLRLGSTHTTDATLAGVLRFQSLGRLNVQGNQGVTNKGVARLTELKSLQSLDLDDTGVTAQCLNSLERMPKLTRLTLDLRRISSDEIVKMQAKLPRVKIDAVKGRNNVPLELFAPLH